MKIAGVSIWIWGMGLVVVTSGFIAVASVDSANKIPKATIEATKQPPTSRHPSSTQPLHMLGATDQIQQPSEQGKQAGLKSTSFLPLDLRNWRLGMSLTEFKKIIPGLKYDIFGDFRITTSKVDPCPNVHEITAYFDLSSENVLYELIVVYSSESAWDQAFGLVMNYPEWKNNRLISLTKDSYVRAWSFDKTFVYKYLGSGPEHEQGGLTTSEQLQERKILKLLK